VGRHKTHTSSFKPSHKAANKVARLKFYVSMLDATTLENADPRFIDMDNFVHIDE
jgi:hypothetical protein